MSSRKAIPTSGILMYGYTITTMESYSSIPKEADVVRMIYANYLSGMGKNAIMRKAGEISAFPPSRVVGGQQTLWSVF